MTTTHTRTMTPIRKSDRVRPQCRWVPVLDRHGRVRMEMRWTLGATQAHTRLAA